MAIHTLLNGRCDRRHPRHHIVDQYESIGTREFDGVVDVQSREGVVVASVNKDEVGAIRGELFQQLRQHLGGIPDEQHMAIGELLIDPFLCLQNIVVASNVHRDDGDVGSRGQEGRRRKTRIEPDFKNGANRRFPGEQIQEKRDLIGPRASFRRLQDKRLVARDDLCGGNGTHCLS